MAMTSLQWPDYLILVAFLVTSLGIGVYHSLTGGRQKTTHEFIMADRRLGVLPTAISMFVSFQSAIMILGLTAEMYFYGVAYLLWIPIAFLLSIVLVERLILPWIYPLKLVSINDYLEQRYESKAVRVLGAVIAILGGLLYMGVAMYAPSAALESATGLPTTVSIPLMAVVSVAYTALGGMRAVIWTDVFQFGTMMGGLLAILIKGTIAVGGIGKVFEIAKAEGRTDLANWNLDPTVRHTVWGFLIGFGTSWVQVYGFSQASVQRYSATETISKARLVLLLNIPAIAVLTLIVCLIGLTVFSFYSHLRCDPLLNGDISSQNQLLSLFVTTVFAKAPGVSGLFLATLYGGALSSVSSSLSGAAANCWDDILKFKLEGMAEHRKALFNRFLVVVFGGIATFVAFMAALVPGPITQVSMTFSATVFGPMLGMFLMGGVSRHANFKGALIGGSTGLLISAWLTTAAFNLGARPPTLPPASVDGCISSTLRAINCTMGPLCGLNDTYLANEETIWDVVQSSTESLVSTSAPYIDANMTHVIDSAFKIVKRKRPLMVADVKGFNRFYTISYIWYTFFGTINTMVIGLITSLIFRDRNAESRVPQRLLIPFRQCLRWNLTVETGRNDLDREADRNGKVDLNDGEPNNNEELKQVFVGSRDSIMQDKAQSTEDKENALKPMKLVTSL